jgi:hypothetical protein
MPDRAMIEASMLLHRDSANYLLALARTTSLDVVVSGRLLDAVTSEPESAVSRLAPRLDVPPFLLDLAVTKQLANELRDSVETYRVSSDSPTWYDGGARFFRDVLVEFTGDELTSEILYEEWLFLSSDSWLFSKTRRAFEAMIEAGGTAFEMSRRAFDQLVRKTLKKANGEPLTPGNRVRAAAKWIAVGGPPIIGVIEPISAAIASGASGYFLLVDP